MQCANCRRLVLSGTIAVISVAALTCTRDEIGGPSQHSLQYEISPPTGTLAGRGATMSVVVRVLDVLEDVRSVVLTMAVQFQRPDGVVDNSFLPGVPVVGPPTSWNHTYPLTLEVRFEVPIGTPEGNPAITPGSRLLELWANLYTEDRALHPGGGRIAVFPVVG